MTRFPPIGNEFEMGGITKSFADPGSTRVINKTTFALKFIASKQKVKVERA